MENVVKGCIMTSVSGNRRISTVRLLFRPRVEESSTRREGTSSPTEHDRVGNHPVIYRHTDLDHTYHPLSKNRKGFFYFQNFRHSVVPRITYPVF